MAGRRAQLTRGKRVVSQASSNSPDNPPPHPPPYTHTQVVEERGLQKHPSWLRKAMELYETYLVRRWARCACCVHTLWLPCVVAHRARCSRQARERFDRSSCQAAAAGPLPRPEGFTARWARLFNTHTPSTTLPPLSLIHTPSLTPSPKTLLPCTPHPQHPSPSPPPPPRQVRHGIMVVGPAGSGKTQLIECLAAALSELGTRHAIWRMNPKAITVPQMFGRLEAATGEQLRCCVWQVCGRGGKPACSRDEGGVGRGGGVWAARDVHLLTARSCPPSPYPRTPSAALFLHS